MNVSLTPQLESLVRQKVDSGLYNSSSEVIREALRLLENQDKLREVQLQEVREAVRTGLDSGDSIAFDDVAVASIKSRGRERLAALKQKD